MKKTFIFRGSPASGKGTITKKFMEKLHGKVIFLELDNFRWGFHFINRTVPEVDETEHALAYKNFLSVLENYLQDGSYTIVTEGVFSWSTPSPHGNMQDILELVKKYDYTPVPILLYADYETLWERNLKRAYSVPEDEFRLLYEHVMQETSEDEIQIDVGAKTVEETVQELLELVDGKS